MGKIWENMGKCGIIWDNMGLKKDHMGICVDDFPSYPIPIIQLIIKQWFTPDLRCEQKPEMPRWRDGIPKQILGF